MPRSGTWNCPGTTTSAKRSIHRFGRPISTTRVRPPDRSCTQSAAIEGRRPMVSTMSGQGGSSRAERSRSRWCRPGSKCGLPSTHSGFGNTCRTSYGQPIASASATACALSPSLSPTSSQTRGGTAGSGVANTVLSL